MLTKYEINNYEGAGFIFMTPQLEILLVNEKRSGKWGMCKGHREQKDGGNPTMTAIREANEELGLLPEDYEIWGEPFVLSGSPKIYIFQRAMLKIDIVDKFKINKLKTMYYKPCKLTEIKDIKLIPSLDFMESIEDLNCNVYVKLYHAWMTGKFVHSNKKFNSPLSSMRSSMTDDEIRTPTLKSSAASTVYSRTSSVISIGSEQSNTDEIRPRPRFYNSSLIGGSPIQTMATNPIHSPIVITQKESPFVPPLLELGEAERASPIRDRAESRNSLYEGLSPRASPVPPYPFMIDRTGSPTRIGGGGAGGPVSPRTCASFILPGSPAILDSGVRVPTPQIR